MTEVTKLAILTVPHIVAAIGPPLAKKPEMRDSRNSRARLRIFRRPLHGRACQTTPLGGPELSGGAHVRLTTAGLIPLPRAGRLIIGPPLWRPLFAKPGLAPGGLFKSGNIWMY